MSRSCLPEKLKWTTHWDYPNGLKWVPRAWTSWNWGRPKMLLGNQKRLRDGAPAPIGEPGSWQVSRYPDLSPWVPFGWLPLYLAFTTKSGRHFRIGARYDDVDHYTTIFTLATRAYPPEGESDTGTL